MEAKGTCKGGEGGKGLHGGCWGALQEGIVCISQRLFQPHCCDLLKRPLHSEVNQQRSEGVALSHSLCEETTALGEWRAKRWLCQP
jgi:hypothetical protein